MKKNFLGKKPGTAIATWDRARLTGGDRGGTLREEAKFCSGRHTFRQINTWRGYNSQPARPPGAKNLLQRGRDVEKILEILEASPENWFWTLPLLYAGGQINISCYPFFDTAPATITHRQARIKKRVLPNTAGHGRGRGDNSQPAPSQTQKIPGVICWHRGNFRDTWAVNPWEGRLGIMPP